MLINTAPFFDFIPFYSGAEYFYSQPVPELEVSGVSPFYGLHLAIWQLRDKDLQCSCPLYSEAGRKKFLAWCVVHGRREYRALEELDVFWKILSMPADIPKTEWSEGISRFLYLAIAAREDLGIDPELHTEGQQKAALFWFFFSGGWRELGLSSRDIPVWQKRFWLDAEDICESRFAGFIYAQRFDLQQAFNLDTDYGKQGFGNWLERHAPQETVLPLLQEPAPLTWGRYRLNRAENPRVEFGVNLIGYAFGELGIGEDVRMAAQALNAVGIPFTVIDFPPGDNIRQNDQSVAEWVSDKAVYNINMVCLTALEHLRLYVERGAALFDGRYMIGYWPWELQGWPQNWAHCFNLVDEIWASSEHTYNAVRQATPLPVKYMSMAVALPQGLDLAASKHRAEFNLPEEKYLFVFSFDGNSFIQRKNPLAVVKAFTNAFPASEMDVGLVVKCMRPDLNNPVWQQIKALAAQDERIIIYDAMLSKLDVMELYRACDCFVSLHRAEGFGRGIAEALLLGLEVIAANHGGNVDFCRKAGAQLVAYKMVALHDEDYVEAHGQYWAEPDIQDAARAMRSAYTKKYNRPATRLPNEELLKSLFSCETVGARYRERLEDIKESLPG
jgi:glycosyltransferase involved in cell wall biosynthesis